MNKMTGINLNDGKFYLNGQSFHSEIDTDVTNNHTVGKNLYSNLSMSGAIKNYPFKATGYYKNRNLKSITFTLEQEYLKKYYHPPNDIDFRDYLTPYVDFWKSLTEKLVNELMNSKKRKFEWEKFKFKSTLEAPLFLVK